MSNSNWSATPASGEWNNPANWVPVGVPTDTVVFSSSSQTVITFSPGGAASVGTIQFAAGAPPYALNFGPATPVPTTPALIITGQGFINLSGITQNVVVVSNGAEYWQPQLKFTKSASAGGPDMSYYAGPVSLLEGSSGGTIEFCDNATAGSALFTVTTGKQKPSPNVPPGAEVGFSDNSTAGTARFMIYGTLSTTDGDTFGNVAFHKNSSADCGQFTNVGGTVKGGDGGNTQLYDNSTAANGVYLNYGGTVSGANGGDVAFDGTAMGGNGLFYNLAASAAGAYGGVTSFNNNGPEVASGGASAGNGTYHNHGAALGQPGGGGHTKLTAVHGSPTAGNGIFINYGSAIAGSANAGYTQFSIAKSTTPNTYFPTAAQGTFWNLPALAALGAAGYTQFEFSPYGQGAFGNNFPTAGQGTFFNQGGYLPGAAGGYTTFADTTTAENATLIAYGGTNGGLGGRIVFSAQSTGGSANVQLYGNGELDISGHTGGLTIGGLNLSGGIIKTQLGTNLTGLTLSGQLTLVTAQTNFSFIADASGFALNTPYTILTAPNLCSFNAGQFSGNAVNGVQPTFAIVGNSLQVSFNQG